MRRTVTIVTLMFTLLAGGATHAADAKLARLVGLPAQESTRFDVLAKIGLQAPSAPAIADAWQVVPAEALSANLKTRPADRLIELYTGTSVAPVLLCRVLVRYYRADAGWVPYFLLDEEPLLVRVNGRWQPIELAPGVPALLVLRGGVLPTADGYRPTLEFSLATGQLPIVGWVVR